MQNSSSVGRVPVLQQPAADNAEGSEVVFARLGEALASIQGVPLVRQDELSSALVADIARAEDGEDVLARVDALHARIRQLMEELEAGKLVAAGVAVSQAVGGEVAVKASMGSGAVEGSPKPRRYHLHL